MAHSKKPLSLENWPGWPEFYGFGNQVNGAIVFLWPIPKAIILGDVDFMAGS